MELLRTWAGKAGNSLVDLGAPVASVATLGEGSSKDLPACGFSIMEGGSNDGVTALLEDHPHFHTPGPTAIEILESSRFQARNVRLLDRSGRQPVDARARLGDRPRMPSEKRQKASP